jgi:hypothetical protein
MVRRRFGSCHAGLVALPDSRSRSHACQRSVLFAALYIRTYQGGLPHVKMAAASLWLHGPVAEACKRHPEHDVPVTGHKASELPHVHFSENDGPHEVCHQLGELS